MNVKKYCLPSVGASAIVWQVWIVNRGYYSGLMVFDYLLKSRGSFALSSVFFKRYILFWRPEGKRIRGIICCCHKKEASIMTKRYFGSTMDIMHYDFFII